MGAIHRFTGREGRNEWEGIREQPYESQDASNCAKRVLIGKRDGARNFCIRYFEIAPGGKSSLDRHDHDHGIYILQGRGQVLMGSELVRVRAGDVLYIPPNETHRLENTGGEILGFLCVAPPRD